MFYGKSPLIVLILKQLKFSRKDWEVVNEMLAHVTSVIQYWAYIFGALLSYWVWSTTYNEPYWFFFTYFKPYNIGEVHFRYDFYGFKKKPMFLVYNIIIQHLYTLQSDHPQISNYHSSPSNWPPSPLLPTP